MISLDAHIEKYLVAVKEHYHWLHAHPELSGKEKETSAYIAAALRKMGLNPMENVGGYGVVALIEGNAPGKCVGLRADFDALPIPESTGLPFASQNPGISHACGHDSHSAMLLGVAAVLNALRDQFSGCVKLVFQPAEEDPLNCGAKKMIADGVLKNPPVDIMLAQHVSPDYPVGSIGVRKEAIMAASDRFFITIHGKNSHASQPQKGIDAIVIGAQVITALQTLVSRSVAPQDSTVVTIGTISGGTRANVIADKVYMEGTCRNLNPAVREAIPEQMERIIRGVTEGMGGTYEFSYVKGYSPTVNDANVYNLICRTANETLSPDNVIANCMISLGGEDFSFFSEKVPACYYRLGCQNPDKPVFPAHHGSFVPDEACFPYGIKMMVNAALNYLSDN